MKKLISLIATFCIAASVFSISVSAVYPDLPDYTDEEEVGVLVDLTDGEYLDDNEIEDLEDILQDAADTVGFSVGVVVTDDIPYATRNYQGQTNYQEARVEDYATYCFDEIFGAVDTADGVLLVVNYYTLYDQIWADGVAEEYINDARTQKIFDKIYPEMKAYDTYGEIEGFANQVVRMYKKGTIRKEYTLKGLGIGLLIGLIIAICVYFSTKSQYSKYPKTAANTYVNRNNTNFVDKNDIFIREYTTKTRRSSSSGGGGRSGGGGGRSGGGRGR